MHITVAISNPTGDTMVTITTAIRCDLRLVDDKPYQTVTNVFIINYVNKLPPTCDIYCPFCQQNVQLPLDITSTNIFFLNICVVKTGRNGDFRFPSHLL